MTETAVVILNYNGRDFLMQFLPSVIAHSGDAKIIVADNGSTDDSLIHIENNFPTVSIIRIPANLGFCGGYNYALKIVQANYYVLLNSDVEVTANWITPVIDLFRTNPTVAAVQPKILSFHEKDKFEYAGAAGGYIDHLGYPFCRGRIFNNIEKDLGQYNDMREIFWATGACLFIRSEIFHRWSGLDEDFFAHMEEIDLCWSIKRAGLQVFYQPASVVYHVGGGTLPASNPRKTYLNFRNALTLLVKHMPDASLKWKLPLRIFLDWVAAGLFLTRGLPADALAIGKAHINFLRNLKRDFAKRRILRSQIGNYTVTQTYSGVLIVDHFIKRKKTFKEIMS